MKKLPLALVFLALVVVGAILLRSGGTDRDDVTPPSRPDIPPPVEEVVLAPVNRTEDREAVDVTGKDGPLLRPIETSVPEGLELRVVRGDTEEPVPGAEVRLVDMDGYRAAIDEAGGLNQVSFHEVGPGYARRFLADPEGRVVLPPVLGVLTGLAPGLWGMGELHPEREGLHVLRLHPDGDLRVRVVDGEGRPRSGQEVAVSFTERGYGGVVIETRAPNGIAVFAHARAVAAMTGNETSYLALVLPRLEPVVTTVDLNSLPTDAVELVMPACGVLEIRVAGEEGEVLDERIFLSVVPVGENAEDLDVEDPGQSIRRRMRPQGLGLPLDRRPHVLEAGETVLRLPVGLRMDLDLHVRTEGDLRPAWSTVRGPTRLDEVVAVTARLGPVEPAVVARILDTDGEPLREVRFESELCTVYEGGGTGSRGSNLTTDADGRFRYVLRGDPYEGGQRTLSLSDGEVDEEIPPRELRIDLSFPLEPGDNDLGDLAMTPTPVIAAGRVVNEIGAAVHGARVVPGWAVRTLREPQPIDWIEDRDLQGTTDEDGRFVLRGHLARGDEWGLKARHEDHVASGFVPFAPGATDVLLVLSRTGRIVGFVRMEPSEKGPRLEVRARSELSGNESEDMTFLRGPGAFSLSVLPGRYTVTIAAQHEDPLFEVRAVDVLPGRTTEDPRLNPVDLTGRLLRIVLTVVDPHGAPVPGVMASYRAAGDEEAKFRHQSSRRGGTVAIDTRHPSIDVHLSAEGRRSSQLRNLQGDRTVTLDAGLPVRIVLADRRALPSPGYELHIRIEPAGGKIPWSERGRRVDNLGEALLSLGQPGSHGVMFSVGRTDEENSGVLTIVDQAEELTIEVADTDREQTFTLSVSPAAVRRAEAASDRRP